jgi:hypothetical protein
MHDAMTASSSLAGTIAVTDAGTEAEDELELGVVWVTVKSGDRDRFPIP